MAYTKKATNAENETAQGTVETTSTVKKKRFEPEDLITCVSITPGEMFYMGQRSKTLYSWADIDCEVDIEYRDLEYAARSKDHMLFEPKFIIKNDDFLEMFPALNDVYSGLYNIGNLEEILRQTPSQIKHTVDNLPKGAKEALKIIAFTAFNNGSLDSIQKIKALDEALGTKMMFTLNNK